MTHQKQRTDLSEKLGMGAIYVILFLLVVVCIFPFYHILVISFSEGMAVMQGKVTFWPKGITLASYQTLLSDPYVPDAYRNTIVYVLVGTAVNIFLTTLCAYPLSRRDLVGKKLFIALIVFTMVFSGGMIPTYILVAMTLKLKGTFWAAVLVNGMSTFNMIVMRTFFQTTIPESLTEAANIDGANDLTIFWRIVLPLSKPIMATMVLFYAVAQWNRFFDYMLYLNNKAQYPLQMLIRAMVIEGNLGEAAKNTATDVFASETGIKYAAIVITIAPIMLMYPFIQKYLVKGQMVGSIKG